MFTRLRPVPSGIDRPAMRWCLTALVLACFALPAVADDKLSQDEILAAVRRGDLRPFSEIEEKVRAKLPGAVIKVEVERDDGMLVYEFRTLDSRGRRHDVYIDGKTGDIVEIKRK